MESLYTPSTSEKLALYELTNPYRALRIAIPNKGRLRGPTISLLRSAGLSFDLSEGTLATWVHNVPIEILFVRSEDVVELVADGTTHWGITGQDLVEEINPTAVEVSLKLGYGHCSLTLAAPINGEIENLEDLDGKRIATSHPNIVKRFFADYPMEINVVPLRGAVEVAPRLGVADAVADLVSSGNTLRVNRLNPMLPILLTSQAVLIKGPRPFPVEIPDRPPSVDPVANILTDDEYLQAYFEIELNEAFETALKGVLAGRNKRYLLLNTAEENLETIAKLAPGLESPTVMPLAEDGMVAIHTVVAAYEVWELLPKLKEAGGRDILVLPIEKLVP